MSDDEYYADSPYDEFEEMLYDADPGPNLADDLAQHAAYSPVWQDDPSGELELYHSDWEYYSDDYYDDDPAILGKNPLDGTSPATQRTSRTSAKRGRKRKLEETDIVLEPAANQCLKDTIRGTVWAENTSTRTKIFKTGQQEKVALLIDWRKRPQSEDGKSRSYTNTKLLRDESWANDLSLEDMGLRRVREHAGAKNEIVDEGDERDEDDADDEKAFTERSESTLGEDLDETENGNKPTSQDHENHRLEANRAKFPEAETSINTNDEMLQERHHVNPRERLNPSESPSRQLRHTKTTNSIKSSLSMQSATYKDASTKAVESQMSHKASQKKRKLSVSAEDSSMASRSTASSRAKRVASTKLGQDKHNDASLDKPPASNTRSARSRKK